MYKFFLFEEIVMYELVVCNTKFQLWAPDGP